MDEIAAAPAPEPPPPARPPRAAALAIRWQPALRRLPGFWPSLLWIGGLAIARRLYPWSAAISAAIWGLLILLAFIAWGRVLVRAFYPEREDGWGLHGSLGMALTVAAFGVLACFRLVSVRTIVGWTVLGPLLFDLQRVQRGVTLRDDARALVRRILSVGRPPQAVAFLVALVVVFVFASLNYADAVMDASFNPWDDEMAYRGFARQFLDQGTLYEPFSFRRVGAYGGQSLLQAFVLARADARHVHIFDNGIAVLLILGLITGYRAVPRWTARAAVLAAGFMLVTLPYSPHNLGSAFSGVVVFLALFRLLDDPGFPASRPMPNAVMIGLLTAAGCTLRQNYFSAAIGFVAFWYLWLVVFPGAKRRAEWFKQGAATALAVIGFLAPWVVLAIIATRTPFYPMIAGNVRPDFGMVGKVTFDEEVRWTLTNLFTFRPIGTIAMLFAAGFMMPGWRRSRAVHVFLLATVFAFCVMLHFFQNFRDADSIARYYFGFTVALAFAVTLSALTQASARRAGALPAAGLVLFAIGYQFMSSKDHVLKAATANITAFNSLVRSRGASAADEHEALYKRIQASIPPGERVLVMLDHTHLLDGKRNEVFNFDHPCATGLKPGPPCFQGAEPMAEYLKQHRIRYIAYQLGTSSAEYNVAHWEGKLAAGKSGVGLAAFYERQARFELDFFKTLNALAESRRSLFHEGDVRVLDLQTRAH